MQLNEKTIKEFRGAYKSCFGKEIGREEAYETGVKLIRLLGLIYKPMTENEYEQLQKRGRETNNLKN